MLALLATAPTFDVTFAGHAPSWPLGEWALSALAIALTANLVNLLDLRPGRALKGYTALAVISAVALPGPGMRLGHGGSRRSSCSSVPSSPSGATTWASARCSATPAPMPPVRWPAGWRCSRLRRLMVGARRLRRAGARAEPRLREDLVLARHRGESAAELARRARKAAARGSRRRTSRRNQVAKWSSRRSRITYGSGTQASAEGAGTGTWQQSTSS